MTTLERVRDLARGYPEAYEEAPWGELAAKVNGKVFAFYGHSDDPQLTVKLPLSNDEALTLPRVGRTGYGLGRSGWVTARIAEIPETTIRTWIEESYRAVAPKRLAAQVPEGGPEPRPLAPLPEVASPRHRVVVVTDDTLRGERLLRALAPLGIHTELANLDVTALADVAADAIVVDVGRSASAATDAAGELALVHFDVPLVLAGIKDKKTETKVRQLAEGLVLLRSAPGDPRTVAALQQLLS